nr:PEP-CTERM sorting domain-containing protein [Schlegelella koreensis]
MAAGANGQISSKAGVCTVDFNAASALNLCGATYSESGGLPLNAAHFRTGNSSVAVSPAGDTTTYLAVGPSHGTPVTVTLANPANYFGFYAGSLDDYNTVQFFLNGVLVDSFNGTDINSVVFPNSSANGLVSAFVDYFPGSLYTSIVYASTGNAFETDNHAFGLATPAGVPEPTSTALLGLGLLLLARRRRA